MHDYYDKDGNCSASLAPAKTSCLVVSGKVNEAEAGTASSASKMVLSANRLAWDLEPETQAQCLAAFEAVRGGNKWWHDRRQEGCRQEGGRESL